MGEGHSRKVEDVLRVIGLGLNNEDGISVQGLEEAKKAGVVFAEFYTSIMPALSLDRLESLLGQKVKILCRRDIEEGAEDVILKRACDEDVVLLVPGDPMTATTHVDLRLRAEKRGIKTSVTHAASISSAIVGATGLQNYKFGRTVTLPLVEEGGIPESPYEWINDNFRRGLHTLILLDLQPEKNAFLSIPQALDQLAKVEEKKRTELITSDRLFIGAARVGSPDMEVKGGPFSFHLNHSYGSPPHSLVLPGKLHFMEKEALKILVHVEDKFLEET